MQTGRTRANTLPGFGAICCGLGFIVAASILNVAHDRFLNDAQRLPRDIAGLYEASGKLGVTATLVTVGLAIILVNWAYRAAEARVQERGVEHEPWPDFPYYSPADETEIPTVRGGMALQTRKYLAHQGRSGAVGWGAARKVNAE